MFQLSISAACAYVRKALDELISVEEIGMLVSPDAVDIHKLVEGCIVEAAVRVHTDAPSYLLDGIAGTLDEDYSASLQDKVLTITMKKDCVRIASIKAGDSDYVVCDLIPEDSAEGRKQLNKYTCGTYDDPRVVLMKKWTGEYQPILKYYSLKKDAVNPGITLEYIPYPVIDETIILISPRLEYNVLNEIVALVLDSINESQKAQLYRAKAQNYGG